MNKAGRLGVSCFGSGKRAIVVLGLGAVFPACSSIYCDVTWRSMVERELF